MTLSPKKYVSHFTSSTTNRGVEAKEIEIANTRLDVYASSPPAARAPPREVAGHDDTASYIQVEVRRARRGARLPAASSPAPAPAPAPNPALPPVSPATHLNSCRRAVEVMDTTGMSGAGEVMMMPAVIARGGANSQWHAHAHVHGAGAGAGAGAGDAAGAQCAAQKDDASEKSHGLSVWKKIGGCGDGDDDDSGVEDRPERVEVYYFERSSGAWLATSDGARSAGVERAARGAARRGRALLDEACAVPRLALAAPLAALLAAERAALLLARGAVVGAVQTAADYALKPALALAFNALLHPPLVLAGNVARALRDALRPLWGALGDALDPLARVLANVRLVHVHVERRCACAAHV